MTFVFVLMKDLGWARQDKRTSQTSAGRQGYRLQGMQGMSGGDDQSQVSASQQLNFYSFSIHVNRTTLETIQRPRNV
jgi:hypothetical protein